MSHLPINANCFRCPAQKINIFCNLKPQDLKKINQAKTSHLYRRKQIIHHQEHPYFGIHCIGKGIIKIYRTNPDGKQYIVRLAEMGDILGLPPLFTGITYLWTAQAIEDASVCFIERETILEVVQQNPCVSAKVAESLSRLLIRSELGRTELANDVVRKRMANLLSLLAEKYGVKTRNGTRIEVCLSREEMAKMVGTATETTIRLFKEFRESRLIEIRGKKITILDHNGLIKTAT